jgi:acetyltransferase
MQDATVKSHEAAPPPMRPYPSQYVSSWTTKDGLPVLIRPIRPEDEPLMVRFHESLSERSVYLRYFCSLSLNTRVAHERLVRICFADYDREIPLVVDNTDEKTGTHEILGVGRLSKLPEGNEGELAVVISDQYQGQGLGTELFRRLIQIAKDEGLTQLRGEVLRDNITMQTIMRKLGFSVRMLEDPATVHAILEL